MIVNDVKRFLKGVPPFQFLTEQELTDVARRAALEFYPAGTRIIRHDGAPAAYLHIVKKGGVKLLRPDGASGAEVVVDVRGEGETFGYLSLMSGEPSQVTVTAIEDTLCYLLDQSALEALEAARPDVGEYLLRSVDTGFVERTFDELRRKSAAESLGDSLLFASSAGEVADHEFVRGDEELTVREAAERMTRAGRSALVVVDADGAPSGIVTDSDFRAKVAALGLPPETPVTRVMSSPVAALPRSARCVDAMLVMIRRNIHHLLLTERGEPKAVLSNHDLMLLQGHSPLTFAAKVQAARSLAELADVSHKTDDLIGLLLSEGASFAAMSRILSELHDRVVRRALEFAEASAGAPPVPYAFLVLGAEGRKELTYRTGQENALIYADPLGARDAEGSAKYFRQLAEAARDALKACGFPAGDGGRMAAEDAWRGTASAWKARIVAWSDTQTEDMHLFPVALLDCRHVAGDHLLADELRGQLAGLVRERPMLLDHLAREACRAAPPLGFFRQFLVEQGGERRESFAVSEAGLTPLIDCTRVLALRNGIGVTSTLERLESLERIGVVPRAQAEEARRAFEFLQLLGLSRQKACLEQGGSALSADACVRPSGLTNLERKTLKEAFRCVLALQELLAGQMEAA